MLGVWVAYFGALGVVMGLYTFEWVRAQSEFWSGVAHVFVWATLVTSVGSGISYIVKTRRILAEHAQ